VCCWASFLAGTGASACEHPLEVRPMEGCIHQGVQVCRCLWRRRAGQSIPLVGGLARDMQGDAQPRRRASSLGGECGALHFVCQRAACLFDAFGCFAAVSSWRSVARHARAQFYATVVQCTGAAPHCGRAECVGSFGRCIGRAHGSTNLPGVGDSAALYGGHLPAESSQGHGFRKAGEAYSM
jgi:hypothetical protein